jgi:hypothetical protein
MRAKLDALEEAFTGHFTDHHALPLSTMLARIDTLDADIAALEPRSRRWSPLSPRRWRNSRRSRGSALPGRLLSFLVGVRIVG